MAAIILENVALLDATSTVRRENHHVFVEDDRIKEVSDKLINSASAERIDLAGRTLMPGLIDAHVHAIAVDAALARLAEQPLTLTTLQAGRVLEGMLARGFTTVRDAGGGDGGLAEAIAQGLIRGPRMFPSGQALSQTGGHGDLRPRTRSVVSCACCEYGAGLARIADGVDECRRHIRSGPGYRTDRVAGDRRGYRSGSARLPRKHPWATNQPLRDRAAIAASG